MQAEVSTVVAGVAPVPAREPAAHDDDPDGESSEAVFVGHVEDGKEVVGVTSKVTTIVSAVQNTDFQPDDSSRVLRPGASEPVVDVAAKCGGAVAPSLTTGAGH